MSMIDDIGLQKTQPGGYCLGPYRIERSLGFEQLSGEYLARDMTTDVAVSLRVFRISEEDKGNYTAKILIRLSHPSIASVHFADRIGDQFVVAIDFLEGETLQDALSRKGRLDPREALRILTNVASALEYIHSLAAEGPSGSAHLDLKPSNILLGHDGTVKVIDFRLAQLVGEGAPHIGQILRSPAYMAPEQLQGKPSPKSDLWTVGVLFLEMLLGLPPKEGEFFEGKIASLPGSGEGTGFAGLPEPCKRIILRCMQPNPADRFSSASELATALSAASSALDLPSHPYFGTSVPAGETAISDHAIAEIPGSLAEESKHRETTAGRRAERFSLPVAGIALVAAALTFGIYWLLQHSKTDQHEPQMIAGSPGSGLAKGSRGGTATPTATSALAGGTAGKPQAAPDNPTAASRGWFRLLADGRLGVDYGVRIDRLRTFAASHPGTDEAAQAAEMIRATEEERRAFSAADDLERSPNGRICEKLGRWQDFLSRQTTGLRRNYAQDRIQYWKRQVEGYLGYADLTVRSVTGLPAKDSGFLGRGRPDPYFVLLEDDQVLYRSPKLIDDSSPVWGEKIRIYIRQGMKLYVDVWDDNIFISRRLTHQLLSPLPVDGPFRVSSSGIIIDLEIRRDM